MAQAPQRALTTKGSRVAMLTRGVRAQLLARVYRRVRRIDVSLLRLFAAGARGGRLAYFAVFFQRQLYALRLWRGASIRIHRGRFWRGLRVSQWHVGAALGVFAHTRRKAVFQQAKGKKKRERQKQKALSKGAAVGRNKRGRGGPVLVTGSRWLTANEAPAVAESLGSSVVERRAENP